MKKRYIWVVRAESQSRLDKQTADWTELASEQRFSILSIINIDGYSNIEFIKTLIEEMRKQATNFIAFESYTILSNSIGQALNIANAINNAGGKTFVFSPAVHKLVEIPQDKLHYLFSIDDFITLEEDDLPFFLTHANKDVNLQTVINHLASLMATLELTAVDEWSQSLIISEIRHTILLAQLSQLKPY